MLRHADGGKAWSGEMMDVLPILQGKEETSRKKEVQAVLPQVQ